MKLETTVFDVLCVGHACLDMVFQVPKHPGEDEKLLASQLTICGGGPASNAAVAISRLGFQSAFLGYLGKDIHGRYHLRELRREGVRTEWVIRGNYPTPLVTLLVKPDGKRSAVNFKDATHVCQSHSIHWDEVRPSVILFDGHEPDISPGICEEARKRKLPTVLDAGSLHKGTEILMRQVDYLVASEPFAQKLTGETDPEKMMMQLGEMAPAVVITFGHRGLIWKKDGTTGQLGAFHIHAVDTTGAGDAFHGAFAAGLSQKMDWEELLIYASAVGALTCTKVGARPALPDRNSVEQFMKAYRIGSDLGE